jgi:hypothetical protein
VAASHDATPALTVLDSPKPTQVDSGCRYTHLPPCLASDTDVTPASVPIPQTLHRYPVPSHISNATLMSPSHSYYHIELPLSLLTCLLPPASSSRLAAFMAHRGKSSSQSTLISESDESKYHTR